eukprot:6362096-Prymnesium_polylepis.1
MLGGAWGCVGAARRRTGGEEPAACAAPRDGRGVGPGAMWAAGWWGALVRSHSLESAKLDRYVARSTTVNATRTPSPLRTGLAARLGGSEI